MEAFYKRKNLPLGRDGHCRECRNEISKANYQERQRWRRMKEYGLSHEGFLDLLESQGRACAICRRLFEDAKGRRPHVDHDHGRGFVRGLLCNNCNGGLGLLGDSMDSLLRAMQYLEAAEPAA
jgi:hypothetical protein